MTAPMTQRQYMEWKRSLPQHDQALINHVARYHANITAEMLEQAFQAAKQVQINYNELQASHNQLQMRVSALEAEMAVIQRRVTALEQSTTIT
jgi:uncharacterized protein (DUF1778 family)